MSMRALLALALLLIALTGAYFGSQWLTQKQARQDLVDARMTDFNPGDVRALTVQQAGGPVVKAVREDDVWESALPSENIVLDQERWNRMAAAMAIIINRRTLEGGEDRLAEYGLTDPALRVVAETEDGETAEFAFGKQDPIQINRYALAEDGTAFLTPNEIFVELNHPLAVLRYPYVFTVGPAGITRLAFARIWTGASEGAADAPPAIGEESVKVELAREDQQSPWQMIAPVEAPAAQEPVNLLAQELQFLRASDHIDAPESLRDYGLEPAHARVTIQAGDAAEQTLLIGGLDMSGEPEGKLFAKLADRPGVFLIDGHLISLLPTRPDSFRDRRLITGSIGEVERIDFAWLDDQYTIERGPEGGWRITSPEQRDTDQEAVSALLAYLKGLEGSYFATGSPESLGLASPEAMIVLHYTGDKAPSTIKIGAEGPGSIRYVTQDRGDALALPKRQAEALFVPEEHFASKALLRFMRQEVSRLALDFEGTQYIFEQEDSQWRLVEPAGAALQNQADVLAILDAINGAEAELAEEDAPLDDPLLELEITWRPGNEDITRRLRIGAPAAQDAQRRYATVDNRLRLYTLSQEVVTVIRESLRGIAAGPSN